MVRRDVLKRRKDECDIGQHTYFETLGGFKTCEVCGLKQETAEEPGEAQPVEEDVPEIGLRQWKEEFYRHLDGCAINGLPFTQLHVLGIVGPPPGNVQVNVEEMMLVAARREIIRKTGKKQKDLTEWIGI